MASGPRIGVVRRDRAGRVREADQRLALAPHPRLGPRSTITVVASLSPTACGFDGDNSVERAREQSERQIQYEPTGQDATREGDEEAEPYRPIKPAELSRGARRGRRGQPCPVLAPSLELLVPGRGQTVE